MKTWIVTLAAVVMISSGFTLKHAHKPIVLEAQMVPYQLTVTYPASPDAATYTCYLDGSVVANVVTGLTCSFPVATLGAHVVGVTAVNPSFVPNESDPSTLAFTLKSPAKPGALKVK